ncbi:MULTISPECIES: non-homologous end-joining DNA ligase [Catenuloplanes]|uniref:DNA ligase (ATP) n=1 Tax=Catenuloplanes niger TaxID=587534 RepID=A0AAE3ZQI9_9ACTN|nr:non-homologous end-joining DNA ligase [Catenuloplanes niger]MDR7323076.1 bifunctional non-homologous end joining protein LigD [Catenuloplanes niger]
MAAGPRPMLATSGELPAGAGWAFEFKWDGVRALADAAGGVLRLAARSGADITVAYPELTPLGGLLGDALLDGEIVVLHQGRPSFQLLAERMHVRDPARAARLAATRPITYMIFDLLRQDGVDLTGLPYTERRARLEALVSDGPRWAVPPTFPDGPVTQAVAEENRLEGVVAKRLTSTYLPGTRSPDWIKIKMDLTGDFVIGGWRPGVRRIGGLLVGVPGPDGRLLFRGRVGGGIGAATEKSLLALLEPLVTGASPFVSVPREDARGAIWVDPVRVVEVKYGQRTLDARLRFPRFLRLRPDKSPGEVTDDA